MRLVEMIAVILVIVGAINWGLVGVFGLDVIATVLGGSEALLARVVYFLVGVSGLYGIKLFKSHF